MGHRYAELMSSPAVRTLQEELGVRAGNARREAAEGAINDRLGAQEMAFIAARDSFYLATVSESGWPYVQHRGGPRGFLKVLSDRLIAFPDYAGNRQYLSMGHITQNDRVSLLLMDYPNRQRLKILGHAAFADVGLDPPMMELWRDGYRARIERAVVVQVEAFDWNCPQHITPRYTLEEVLALGRRAAAADDPA